VLHLHGLADTNHPIDGGTGTGVSGVEFRSSREAVRILAASNGCGSEPLVERVPTNPDIEVTTWSNCGSGATVRLMTVAGASHAWMGHPAASAAGAALVGEPYPGLDASRTMWSFLAAHPRP
jgi:poly(3-hydroxybutyrate) depolymerase